MTVSLSGLSRERYEAIFGDDEERAADIEAARVRDIDRRRQAPVSVIPEGLAVPFLALDRVEYRSQIDGEMITSRSAHREHLKRHGKEEVGNERAALDAMNAEVKAKRRAERKKQVVEAVVESWERCEQGAGAFSQPVEPKSPDLPQIEVPDQVAHGDIIRG